MLWSKFVLLGKDYLAGLGSILPGMVGFSEGMSTVHLSCQKLRLGHSIRYPSRLWGFRLQKCRHLLLQLRDKQLLGLPPLGVADGSMMLVIACLMLLSQVLGHR